MPKQAIVTMAAGSNAAALSTNFNRLLTAGDTFTLPFDEFQRISGTALASQFDSVAFSDAPQTKRGHDLTAANIAAVPTGATVGRVEPGIIENDAFVLAQANITAQAITAGSVLVWDVDGFGTTVTADRPAGHGGFAGVALAAAADGQYVWMQIDGWVVTANVSGGPATAAVVDTLPEGTLLALGGANVFTDAVGTNDVLAVTLEDMTETGADTNAFVGGVNILRTRRRQSWART